jgi:hypothetical protein
VGRSGVLAQYIHGHGRELVKKCLESIERRSSCVVQSAPRTRMPPGECTLPCIDIERLMRMRPSQGVMEKPCMSINEREGDAAAVSIFVRCASGAGPACSLPLVPSKQPTSKRPVQGAQRVREQPVLHYLSLAGARPPPVARLPPSHGDTATRPCMPAADRRPGHSAPAWIAPCKDYDY